MQVSMYLITTYADVCCCCHCYRHYCCPTLCCRVTPYMRATTSPPHPLTRTHAQARLWVQSRPAQSSLTGNKRGTGPQRCLKCFMIQKGHTCTKKLCKRMDTRYWREVVANKTSYEVAIAKHGRD